VRLPEGSGVDDHDAAPANGAPAAPAGAAAHDPTLLGVAFAGIVSVVVSEDEWDLFDSMIGLTLVFVLLAYGRFRREVVASRWEAIAVGAVWAFCVVLVFGFLIEDVQGWLRWPPVAEQRRDLAGFWFAAVWLAATLAFAAALRLGGERLLHPSRRRGS
jgi:hypothetical protein